MDQWMDGWMDGWTDGHLMANFYILDGCVTE